MSCHVRAIDKLPHTLQLAAESIATQTGWNVSIIAGGLNPHWKEKSRH
jgi:hypothetical protein